MESYKGNVVNGVNRIEMEDVMYIRVKSNVSTVLKSNVLSRKASVVKAKS